MSPITATIEYGIFGTVLAVDLFVATSINDLIVQVNKATEVHRQALMTADDRDGDLRQFTPEYANGHPSFDGIESEFGSGHDFCASVIDLHIDDRELSYRTVGHARLRAAAGLD